MDDRLAGCGGARGGLVLAADAAAAGVSRAAVRWAVDAGHLVPVARGTWVLRSAWEELDRVGRHLLLIRAALARRPDAAACAESAAVVWGMPLPEGPPRRALTVSPRTGPPLGADGVKGGAWSRRSWTAPDEVTVHRGLRVTAPARTVVDLARHHDLPWSLAFADAVLRRGQTTPSELVRAADRNPCAPGHPRAVAVARLADPRPESPLESLARGVMACLGLPRAEPQVRVGRPPLTARVDLAVERHRVAVEADGKVKYTDQAKALDGVAADERRWQDKRRLDALFDDGWECVRFVMADLHRQDRWGRRFWAAVRRSHQRHGWPPPEEGLRTSWL